ncbi:ABC transporter ATP-binding protein [Natranaerobius thermophilus]|uniref:ABC transporter related n=1 Tax=Natranaerobius thermophilus (strain ATCC BAA-1301 / DSM 18059 / JW/NM-WN-LF) TaxID=457570 RepID=B2A6Q3_NATTJ|nr:ABC transporter ATP-binding protein [Natranaerobius thermophilus]ACB84186.1 ABC transporter related [Natranaerobius thermophilus JW/NM-WN-LF]
MQDSLFEIDNVTKIYKKKDKQVTANLDINCSIRSGEIIGLLGPNGAGKSTLVKQMLAHIQPTKGEIRYRGQNVLKNSHKLAQEISYYSQEPSCLTPLQVREAIYFTGRLRGLKHEPANKKTEELISELELTDVKDNKIKEISGGQRRLTGMGITLIGRPSVLILDEPTNELDPEKRKLVWKIIREKNKQDTTVILVTHNILEAEQVVDRVAVINNGKLQDIDTVDKLKQRVDQRLKCQVSTESGANDSIGELLDSWGTIISNTETKVDLLIDKEKASSLVKFLTNNEQDLPIENFSIIPPSLEDVYFQIHDRYKREELQDG